MIILVKRKHPDALREIFEAIDDGQLSDQDACELIKLNPDFTLPTLCNIPETPSKKRIIQKIVTVIPEQDIIVLTKFWVRTNAGWGCIEEITREGSDETLYYYNCKKDKPKLSIILHPDQEPENISVDLESGFLHFPDAKNVYICTQDECRYFATSNLALLRNEHTHATHDGTRPRFLISKPSFKMDRPVVSALAPPEDQLS